jgi:transcriptional regulator with XRE-family HTH domain
MQKELGERLHEARIAAGFAKKSVFARRTGIERGTIDRLEKGAGANPNLKTLTAWADACGVSVAELLSGTSLMPASAAGAVNSEAAR